MLKTFCFVSVLTLLLLLTFAFAEEPDKYSYDAQILEKMIRMEHKVEKMENEIKQTQSKIVTVLEQVSQVLENKTTELELLQDRIEMPVVAFSAYDPVDKSLDTFQLLILKNVTLNKGDGYDNVTGIFTSPVTGLYYFTVHVCTYSGKGFYYGIILEHRTIALSTQYDTNHYDCSSVTAITMVTTGQRVWVKCINGDSSSQQLYEGSYTRTTFSGVLLQR